MIFYFYFYLFIIYLFIIYINILVSPTCVDFCRTDPSKLIVSYNNAKLRLFDIETGKLILTFSGSDEHYGNIYIYI